MKKLLLAVLSVIIINCQFFVEAKAEELPLNKILGLSAERFTQSDLDTLEKKINYLNEKLNLTDVQKQQENDIAVGSSRKLNIYRAKFIEEKTKLINLRKRHASITEIQAQNRIVKSIKVRMMITNNKNIANFEEILTQEQKEIFDKFIEEYKQLKVNNNLIREPRNVKNREEIIKNLEN